ncbi:MAG: 50S ribosomal protein L6 [Candidatus Altiarchaeum hamiconexum]|uniref:50S ribosomal protein L6 n=1 Tax=Candidatus Altarchaeum hamiconexum TaxID=1803513 RepID=A0A8J8CG85_9ARCH|nr:50S ribosomal protein L6 [Candidatus Altarchaeum hamiconexum]OIQ04872.1 MAG: 50S ribosomal protein L6 [Candidatus Altarchaeum sp. CG2_30_32_3053]PIN67257.1 MAG: 50S ribosomal protein L6 [Candidatus Altarchaeum sp. CG12_big_fil_rev_8_21_14_0_65_33_22]PIV27668.1 MAG: 50S ribosomal protein L6 [Candidatus Altarchaeum sp. CG03_land_8_20_14_0_80_32_618]PIX48767.1 MAG: 50S ribosomal protein L6 [Candidatus Altarchaeum sp. CG_4_8_14_3_um_filter_33_2054]PIZ29618.1 MAG: 50S ribosomal protein L6 [Candi
MEDKILIPQGTNVEITNDLIKVKGKYGEIEKKFDPYDLQINTNEKEVIISTKTDKKREKKLLNTYYSHINNMIKGANNKVIYKLKLVFSHFPVSLEVNGKELMIKNFLGEKSMRRAKILDGVNVKVSGKDLTVEGIDIEKTSQTAANIEQAGKIKNKDRRVFQDGIYIIEKDGVLIK